MDPVIESDWHMFKTEPFDDSPNLGNVARSWQWRERGLNPYNCPSNKTVLENTAEDILVQKPLKIKSCDLPGHPRSTFLMVFSPDGTKVASTHGNHDVYVSELASGKHVKVLKGHPRTPWCIAFHPSHPELIGSGCLGGQVRVWDIKSGDSEVWNVRNETVIASIAFHPREQLLVIATFNELYFWDWSQPAPFTKVCTNNVNEKVRYVAFDALGYKLITGISLWATSGMFHTRVDPPSPSQSRRDSGNNNDNPGNGGRGEGSSGSARDMIMNSYESLVQRYDSLVRNYQRLFRVRHRLSNTPPPPNTIDRGTDPMETDSSPTTNWTRTRVGSSSRRRHDDGAGPSTSTSGMRRQDGEESGDGDASSSRLLNLDVLSFDNPTRSEDSPSSPLQRSTTSAFQPLNETQRSFRTIDQNERSSRLLPNPFSSSTGPYTLRRSGRTIFNMPSTDANSTQNNESASRVMGLSAEQARVELEMLRQRLRDSHDRNQGSSRTSVLLSPTEFSNQQARTELERLRQRLRDLDRSHERSESASRTSALTSPTDFSTQQARTELERLRQRLRDLDRHQDQSPSSSPRRITSARDRPSTSQRPTMTNSSTQMTPGTSVDAQTINESLDLIRDILRDSGTRLLNLITDMSLSIASTPDSLGLPTRRGSSQPPSEEGPNPSILNPRPLIRDRLLGSNFRRVLFSSSSDSDSDQSSEVSIFRTRNSTFQESSQGHDDSVTNPSEMPTPQPTDRIVVDLDENARTERGPSRFRVRSNSVGGTSSTRERRRQNTDEPGPSTSSFSSSRPSTSRDPFFTRNNEIPPAEAYRKVRSGVSSLQKHTVQLTDMWVRGQRVTMRELRTMWENLRRRVLSLHREIGRPDMPSYYTRSLLERCMMLTDVYDNVSRATPRGPRSGQRSERNEDTGSESLNTENASTESQPGTSSQTTEESRLGQSSRTSQMRSLGARTLLQMKRRFTPGYRWRLLDDPPRRSRNMPVRHRYLSTTRSRREFDRSMEISATRHEIRMRAMQVLSVMFNMMMMCLEERGLSQLIITMLRTLKKALALTCLMLMTNRNANRSGVNRTVPFDPLNLIHIENSENSESVDVDETTETNSETVTRHETNEDYIETPETTNTTSQEETFETVGPVRTPKVVEPVESRNQSPLTSTPTTESSSNSQRWSNRLAVQIAAANRNTSTTARRRREMYLESRRLKALHRTNPNAHPLIKKRILPPIAGHRIPALRCLPRSKPRASIRNDSPSEPVAGPSTANDNPVQEPRPGGLNDFEHRVHSIRLAHLHAVYLRNAARSRFRRLQTIRLYTPSAVREMFTHQSSNDNQPGNLSPVEMSPDLSTRRLFRYHGPTVEVNRSEERRPFQPVSNNSAMPMMQVNDSPPTPEAQSAQPYRVPRIHEYLQPIILAQNSMVVDEDVNGSNAEGGGPGNAAGGVGARLSNMAGLLDAGIISEALPAPSHRVQAWDFTTGDTPQIADSTKNVVVQRCRIHNDASIDISKDGRILVALLPVPRMRNSNHWLGVYSLEWSRLGQCLHTAALEQSAVSVALSPTARHLAVGLGSRRFTTAPQHLRSNVFAALYRLEPLENSSRTGLSPIKELEQNWEQGFTSLNCLRWAPQPGQGLVYANNTGQLIIMS